MTWPSRNASWPSEPKATWTATPEWERRSSNTATCVRSPAMKTSARPKSTWASSPGSWWATIATSMWSRCELAAARADVPADGALGDVGALLVDEALPDPARRVALLARGLLVLGQPGADRRGMRADRRLGPDSTGLRGGGTADARAWRTARRCTLCRRASSRIDTPSSRCSRRIRSNCSTLDNSFLRRFGWPRKTNRAYGAMGSGVGPVLMIKLAESGASSGDHAHRHAQALLPLRRRRRWSQPGAPGTGGSPDAAMVSAAARARWSQSRNRGGQSVPLRVMIERDARARDRTGRAPDAPLRSEDGTRTGRPGAA